MLKNLSWVPIRDRILKLLGLAIGAAIYAAGLELFLVPNDVIDGGVVGISLILAEVTDISFSVWIIVVNAPFFLLGLKRLGKEMFLYSSFAVVFLSGISPLFHHMHPITYDPFLATIFGGIVMGLGVGIVIRCGGALDGTEIVAIMLDHKSPFSVGEIILFFNIFIMGTAGFVFSLNSAMYSLVTYFLCSRMIDMVSEGLDSTKGIFIVSKHHDAVAEAIIKDMKKTVTLLHGQGGFLRDHKEVLYCVVSRLEITMLKEEVRKADPDAFISIFDVQEVEGGLVNKGKKH